MTKNFTLLFLGFLTFISCGQISSEPVTKHFMSLSTVITLTFFDVKSDDIFTKIQHETDSIYDKMSADNPKSEISQINAQAGIKPVKVSPDTFGVMKRALNMAKLSEGAFDPSIGPITALWNISGKPHVATSEELAKTLPLVNWHNIEINEAQQTIFLKQAGMRLDFGGIAKGWAVDESVKIAKAHGISSGLLNMGDSTIYTLGKKPGNRSWRIGVQDPIFVGTTPPERGKPIGVIECSDADVETSGPYEQFFIQNGKRYHHIMDPKTGQPVENNLEQVSLVMPSSVDLPDGLSTTCFILGVNKGMRLIESLHNVAAIFITHDKKIYLSSKAKNLFQLTDNSFTLADVKP